MQNDQLATERTADLIGSTSVLGCSIISVLPTLLNEIAGECGRLLFLLATPIISLISMRNYQN